MLILKIYLLKLHKNKKKILKNLLIIKKNNYFIIIINIYSFNQYFL